MNRLQQLRETLFGFVDQTDDLLLIINMRDFDVPIVLKTIESVDREAPGDLFMSFGAVFESLDGYLDAVMQSINTQIEGANHVRAEDGLEPWPPLPLECMDPQARPGPRIHAAMTHVRGLFPTDQDHRLVWSFLPAEIRDVHGYLRLVEVLLPWQGTQPWMISQRVILRDDKTRPFLIPELGRINAQGTLVFDADFSAEAAADDLVQAAQSPETPEQERMTTLLQLAGLDLAHGRHSEAIGKYGIVHEYFEQQQRPAFQAICMAGVADVLWKEKRLDDAKTRYQQALALASQAELEGLGPTMIASGNVGQVCMERGEYAEAEGYFGIASEVAGALTNIQYKCDMMENIGLARLAQRNHGGAVEIWQLARNLCEEGHYLLRWRSVLHNLEQTYRSVAMTREADDAEQERLRVEALLHREGWPGW